MPRANFVKAARKDNPVAKKGESYWWWKPMVGGRGGAKRYSKERPTRSQLTQSDFYGQLYGIQDEGFDGVDGPEDLRSLAEDIRNLGQEQQEKYDNMPDGLQQGDTGQLLEERAQGCESWADEIDQIADAWETAIEEKRALVEEWEEYDRAEEEYDDSDPDADEPEEPSEDRPDETWEADLKDEKVGEARDADPGL